jgi:hypothetical protein
MRRAPRDHDEVEPGGNRMLIAAEDFTKEALHAIACHGVSNCAGNHNTDARRLLIATRANRQKEPAAVQPATGLANCAKIRTAPDSLRGGQPEANLPVLRQR